MPLRRLILAAWMIILILSELSNPLLSYPGRDGGIFLYIGGLILKGKIPYLDAWENKGPLVFYINAAGLYLADGSRWGVWLVEWIFLLGAAWAGYAAVSRTMGPIAAAICTFVWLSAAGNVLQGGNFTEEYALLFTFVTVWAYLKSLEGPKSRYFALLVGGCLGSNLLLRPNLVGMQAAVMAAYAVLAIRSREWRILFGRLGLIALGGAAVLVPTLVFFALHGALQEMIDVVILFNYQYSDGISLTRVLDGVSAAFAGLGGIFIACAAAGYGMSVLFISRRGALQDVHGQFLLLPLIGWPLEAGLSSLSGRNYLHYFIGWPPYLGLLSAWLITILSGARAARLGRFVEVLLLLLALPALTTVGVWRGYGEILTRSRLAPGASLEYRDPVASYVRAHTSPGEEVFIWGFRPIVNFASDRDSPVSFLPYPLVHVDSPLADRWADQFYAQFTTEPPVLIVNLIEPADVERIPDLDPSIRRTQNIKRTQIVLAKNLQATLAFIEQNYELLGEIDGHGIYRLIRARR